MPTTRTARLAAALLAAAFGAGPALAADAQPAAQKDRADCDAGRTAEDRATCLKEAGAAAQERKRKGLDTPSAPSANAAERCNALAGKEKADCLARIDGPAKPNQQVTTSGSVAGGGILRETKTTTTGPAVVVTPASAASAPR